MKKIVPVSLFPLAAAVVPSNAMALDTASTHDVAPGNGLGPLLTNAGRCDVLSLDETPPYGPSFQRSSREAIQGTSGALQPLSQICIVDEHEQLGNASRLASGIVRMTGASPPVTSILVR